MIISCPSCKTKYTVPAQSLGATGRIVKCSKCGDKWHQEAANTFQHDGTQFEPPKTEPQTEPPLEQQAEPHTTQQAEPAPRPRRTQQTSENIPPFSPKNLPALSTTSQPQNLWPGIMIGIAATIGLVGAALMLKDPMLRAFPAMQLALQGTSSPAHFDASYTKAPGLVIEKIERDILEDDGFTTYVIQGLVTNANLSEKAVPNLMVSLLDEHGNTLDSWKVEPQKRVLQAGESTTWICYFYNPPLAKVSEYKVTFANQS